MLDADAATRFGLEEGRIYEIAFFHAERHTTHSHFKLTLGGFVKAGSECYAVCGDGIVTPPEECDDGVNDGSYGSCMPNCTRGQYCGDGFLRADHEECDNGVNLSTYRQEGEVDACAPGCVLPPYCGDGSVDSLFGEVCDDGINDGGYGQCEPGCRRGAYCGDGILDETAGEECDDGNNRNGDGCDAECDIETIH